MDCMTVDQLLSLSRLCAERARLLDFGLLHYPHWTTGDTNVLNWLLVKAIREQGYVAKWDPEEAWGTKN